MVYFNPDNHLEIRGHMIIDDVSDRYRHLKQGRTVADIPISVFSYRKFMNKDKYRFANDLITVTFFGHVKDDEGDYPNGGLLEKFLSVASKKTTVTIFAHLESQSFIRKDGTKGRNLAVIADTFRSDNAKADLSRFVSEQSENDGDGLTKELNSDCSESEVVEDEENEKAVERTEKATGNTRSRKQGSSEIESRFKKYIDAEEGK